MYADVIVFVSRRSQFYKHTHTIMLTNHPFSRISQVGTRYKIELEKSEKHGCSPPWKNYYSKRIMFLLTSYKTVLVLSRHLLNIIYLYYISIIMMVGFWKYQLINMIIIIILYLVPIMVNIFFGIFINSYEPFTKI